MLFVEHRTRHRHMSRLPSYEAIERGAQKARNPALGIAQREHASPSRLATVARFGAPDHRGEENRATAR